MALLMGHFSEILSVFATLSLIYSLPMYQDISPKGTNSYIAETECPKNKLFLPRRRLELQLPCSISQVSRHTGPSGIAQNQTSVVSSYGGDTTASTPVIYRRVVCSDALSYLA